MSKKRKWMFCFLIVIALAAIFSVTAFAVTEEEVQNQIAATSKEEVSGNVFIWFLCAVAFLKVSQKIDSFMQSLGINVGNTGGSMLGEAMIAARGISAIRGGSGSRFHGTSNTTNNASQTGFMSGGLAGAVGRQFSRSAAQFATGQKGGLGGISGRMFQSSLNNGGTMANNVIGAVAKGNIASAGTMTGDLASQAIPSYFGQMRDSDPSYTNAEIGGGRITATEISPEHPNGIQVAMYNADQYMTPEGNYSKIQAVDDSVWYKQYATDSIVKEPYMNSEGNIAYHEHLEPKLPPMPKRKDRV